MGCVFFGALFIRDPFHLGFIIGRIRAPDFQKAARTRSCSVISFSSFPSVLTVFWAQDKKICRTLSVPFQLTSCANIPDHLTRICRCFVPCLKEVFSKGLGFVEF